MLAPRLKTNKWETVWKYVPYFPTVYVGSGNVSAQVNNPFPSIAGAAVFAGSNYYYVQDRYKKDLLKLEPIIHFIYVHFTC